MDQGIPGIEIGERLAGDAVGECYAATEGGALRTLRILRADLAGRDDARLLFAEEARRIGRIEHPALLAVHRQDPGATRPWMLADPIGGGTLAAHVETSGPLAAEAALALAEGLAGAFAYLEGRRQIHAAPVPSRIVHVEGRWRLVTFRNIRAWDELKSLKGKRYADLAFAPPEHAREHPERLSPHPFLAWAVGTVLRFAAGGGPPGTEEGTARPLPDEVPRELAGRIARLTAPDPGARPQGVRALEAVLAGAGAPDAGSARPTIQAPVPRRRKRRR